MCVLSMYGVYKGAVIGQRHAATPQIIYTKLHAATPQKFGINDLRHGGMPLPDDCTLTQYISYKKIIIWTRFLEIEYKNKFSYLFYSVKMPARKISQQKRYFTELIVGYSW